MKTKIKAERIIEVCGPFSGNLQMSIEINQEQALCLVRAVLEDSWNMQDKLAVTDLISALAKEYVTPEMACCGKFTAHGCCGEPIPFYHQQPEIAYRWRYKNKALGNTDWMFMAAIPSDMLLDNVEIEPLFSQPQVAILQRLISALKPFSAVADNAIDWPQDAHVLRPGIDYPAHIENAAPPVLVKHLREAGEAYCAAINQGQG